MSDKSLTAGRNKQLQMLLKQSKGLAKAQTSTDDLQGDVRDLQERLDALARERAELEAELRALPEKSFADSLADTYPDSDLAGTPSKRSRATKAQVEASRKKAERASRKRQFEEMHVAYRLAGRTLFEMDDGELGVRFETAYRGKYCETFYAIVEYSEKLNRLDVVSHTLPYFLGVEKLAKELLGRDIKLFLDAVHDRLTAYVHRREELRMLERSQNESDDRSNSIINLVATAPLDVVEFDVVVVLGKGSDRKLKRGGHVKLKYGNATSTQPTEALVTEPVAESSRAATRKSRGRMVTAERAILDMKLTDVVAEWVTLVNSDQ